MIQLSFLVLLLYVKRTKGHLIAFGQFSVSAEEQFQYIKNYAS